MLPFVFAFQIATANAITIAPKDWQFVAQQSGPVNYYSVVSEADGAHLRSRYQPGTKTAVMGWKTPEADRHRIQKMKWTWRALKLPANGDECVKDHADSAAVVYVTWKRMLRYYTLKYVWSGVGTKGRVCDVKRNPFLAQETVILESGPGGPKTEELDLTAEFRRHFDGEPPDFVGIGLMSDGDQTQSESSADWGDFILEKK